MDRHSERGVFFVFLGKSAIAAQTGLCNFHKTGPYFLEQVMRLTFEKVVLVYYTNRRLFVLPAKGSGMEIVRNQHFSSLFEPPKAAWRNYYGKK
ncbi:hypothetical protein D7V86_08195 [bacterium D16-51]|nr:hypothetical protein D7V96_08180 [bacterium D16-59]RKI60579.1 hypothetical protein D7V86_08195 [bacterium D16-51]